MKITPWVAGIEFAEGPTFDNDGNLYFVNYVRNGTIGRRTPEGRVEIWIEIEGGQANGLKCDSQNRLIVADYLGKRLLRISQQRVVEVLADQFEGRPFLGLNDVCLDAAENIYFSDPTGSTAENPFGAVYFFSRDGDLRLVDSGLAFPNGLAVSMDQKRLLVAETYTNRILEYTLAGPGRQVAKRVFHQFPNATVDGIDFDVNGNLWVARWTNGTVDVIQPDGSLGSSIDMGGDQVTNLTWWDEDLYVTIAGRNSIYRVGAGVRGAYGKPAISRS